MFKYRLSSGSKLPGTNALRMYVKSVGFYGSLIAIGLLLFLWLRIAGQSKLKDLGESRFRVLNEELKRLPYFEESRDSWRRTRIDGTMILSAYLDTRPEVVLEENSNFVREDSAWAMIRIISILPVNLEDTELICHYRYRHVASNKTYILQKASIGTRLAAFQENFGMYYCAAYILCELPGRLENTKNIILPHEVTVTTKIVSDFNDFKDDEFVVIRYPKDGWKNLTNVEKQRKNDDDEKIMAVCVQPFHHKFDQVTDLVSFVEFYRMMGVGRFTFYRDSVSSRIDEVLDYYSRNGIATIIQWRLPNSYVHERNLRVDGIFAALNDCLYRSTFHASYRYVAGVDIDEYIVPRKHDNYREMMDYLDPREKHENELTGAWIFRNMFFYLMHQDDTITLRPDLPKLRVHTKTMRWERINPPRDRSKFIVYGRDIVDLGNHHVWTLKRSWSIFGRRYKEVAVDPLIAGSHHYRKCETNVEACWRRPTIIDRTAHRFTNELGERTANVTRIVFPSGVELYGTNRSLP